MLVSSIARLNAIHQKHEAHRNIMNTHMRMGSMLRSMRLGAGSAFGGYNMDALHAMDEKMQMDLEGNKLLYLFYSAWEKALAKQQQQEIKETAGGLNLMA